MLKDTKLQKIAKNIQRIGKGLDVSIDKRFNSADVRIDVVKDSFKDLAARVKLI